MAGVKKQDGKESSRSKLRSEAEKKVARSAGESAPLKKQFLDKLVHELRVHQVELEMQNEELRGAQEQIAKSRNDYADLYDFSPAGYLTFNGDALITGVNLTGAALLGVERQKLLKRRFRQFVAHADAELWDRHFVSVLQQGEKQSCDLLLRRKDGSTLHARLDSIRVAMDDGTFVVRTGMSDITIQKQAEESLRLSKDRYRTLVEGAFEGIIVIQDGKIVFANPRAYEIIDYPRDRTEPRPFTDFIHPDDVQKVIDNYLRRLKGEQLEEVYAVRLTDQQGNIKWAQISTALVKWEGKPATLTFLTDISEIKIAEKKLRESEERYRTIARLSSEFAYSCIHTGDDGYKVDWITDAFFTLTSYSEAKLREQGCWMFTSHPDDRKMATKPLRELKAGESDTREFRIVTRDGRFLYIINYMECKEDPDAPGGLRLFGAVQNITERKLTEEALRSEQIMLARTEGIAHVGSWEWDIATDTVTWSDELFRIFQRDPQEGAPSFAEHPAFYHPDDMSRMRQAVEVAVADGIPYELELRAFRKDGETRVCIARGVAEMGPGGRAVRLFGSLQDITERKQSEEKLLKSYESVKKTLNDAINTMVKIVELRDPYTAGHQQKVAELATAIAREMKLEDTRIDQLRMAATIHDIGKMYIPADMLSRPGKLTDMEFALIKTHSQSGYDIVKSMDFPGVVAEAVLQHHERLDGSGYPNQLKSEDTLLEAKILAVADVIEAMASHRPYRPALGIDKALEEISKNRGKLYDPDVVDTCLGLFNSGRFEFKPV